MRMGAPADGFGGHTMPLETFVPDWHPGPSRIGQYRSFPLPVPMPVPVPVPVPLPAAGCFIDPGHVPNPWGSDASDAGDACDDRWAADEHHPHPQVTPIGDPLPFQGRQPNPFREALGSKATSPAPSSYDADDTPATARISRSGSWSRTQPEAVRTCPQCKRVFSSKANMQNHVRAVHDGVRDYECPECGKAFTRPSHMLRHIRGVHQDARDFACDRCTSAFAEMDTLREHVRTVHDGERRFVCSICSKAFGRACHLARHKRSVHLKERNHKCDACGKAYSAASELRNHIQSAHEAAHRHPCLLCDKVFTFSGHLRRHVRLCHTDKPRLQCPECSKSYVLKKTLENHLEAVHGISPPTPVATQTAGLPSAWGAARQDGAATRTDLHGTPRLEVAPRADDILPIV